VSTLMRSWPWVQPSRCGTMWLGGTAGRAMVGRIAPQQWVLCTDRQGYWWAHLAPQNKAAAD
jgi:hypothetical protein